MEKYNSNENEYIEYIEKSRGENQYPFESRYEEISTLYCFPAPSQKLVFYEGVETILERENFVGKLAKEKQRARDLVIKKQKRKIQIIKRTTAAILVSVTILAAAKSCTSQFFNKSTIYYMVEEGDTLESICHKYNNNVEKVISDNDLHNGEVLRSGAVIRLKASKKLAEKYQEVHDMESYERIYSELHVKENETGRDIASNCKKIYKRVIVDYGQSLSEIAYTFINNEQYENRNIYPSGYDLVDEICLINGISKSDTLQVGTILTVPCYILKEDFKEEEKINSTVEVDNNYNDSYGRHL